jgi:hypothetical protein
LTQYFFLPWSTQTYPMITAFGISLIVFQLLNLIQGDIFWLGYSIITTCVLFVLDIIAVSITCASCLRTSNTTNHQILQIGGSSRRPDVPTSDEQLEYRITNVSERSRTHLSGITTGVWWQELIQCSRANAQGCHGQCFSCMPNEKWILSEKTFTTIWLSCVKIRVVYLPRACKRLAAKLVHDIEVGTEMNIMTVLIIAQVIVPSSLSLS